MTSGWQYKTITHFPSAASSLVLSPDFQTLLILYCLKKTDICQFCSKKRLWDVKGLGVLICCLTFLLRWKFNYRFSPAKTL